MYKVYWTGPDGDACFQDFEDMSEALARCQLLRSIGRRFVTMVSEPVGMVGEFGVAETGPDYDWRKRRP